MNIFFFSGKIISDIEFKFIISKNLSFKQCKNTSISYFNLELSNGTIVKIKAYDDFADFCYRKLKKENNIIGYGRIDGNLEVEVMFCSAIFF